VAVHGGQLRAAALTAGLTGCRDRIDTEDLLLGVLAESQGAAVAILSALDVDAAAVRQSVLDRVAQQAS
jgi:Clp amino terminal domain, pathogenicity island component